MREGDIIVMASDGMFDNVYNLNVKRCIEGSIANGKIEDLTTASDCIAKKAEANGMD